jgi:hypothetical protein
MVLHRGSLWGDSDAPSRVMVEQDPPGWARHIDAPLMRLDYRICGVDPASPAPLDMRTLPERKCRLQGLASVNQDGVRWIQVTLPGTS